MKYLQGSGEKHCNYHSFMYDFHYTIHYKTMVTCPNVSNILPLVLAHHQVHTSFQMGMQPAVVCMYVKKSSSSMSAAYILRSENTTFHPIEPLQKVWLKVYKQCCRTSCLDHSDVASEWPVLCGHELSDNRNGNYILNTQRESTHNAKNFHMLAGYIQDPHKTIATPGIRRWAFTWESVLT